MKSKSLTLKTKLGYGVMELGGNLFFTFMGFFLMPFLTDTAKLGAFLAGLACWIGKACDAITDPTVGFLSDRTRTKWGRRRPWMFAGAILLFLTMILQFTNPNLQDHQIALFIWMAVAFCLLTTAYTMVNIPYGALMPELTTDFHERTVINAYRTVFSIIATAIGSIGVLQLKGMFTNMDTGWTVIAAIMGGIMLVSALITVFTVKEPRGSVSLSVPEKGIIEEYWSALKTKPVRYALFPYMMHITGITVIQSGLMYYYKYIYQNEGGAMIALAIMLGVSFLCVPVCTFASRRLGKKLTSVIGLGIFGAAVLAFFLIGYGRGVEVIYVTMGIAGIGLSTQYILPFAMIPDIVDYDFAETGVRREGVFFSMWTFIGKVGQAFALLLCGLILDLFKYVPNVAQTEQSKLGIRLLIGPVPVIMYAAGMVILIFYPITRKYYETVIAPGVAKRERKV